MPRKPPCCVRPPRGRGVPAVPSPRRDRDVCASQSGGAINNDGGSLEVNRSFFGNNTAGGEGEAVRDEAEDDIGHWTPRKRAKQAAISSLSEVRATPDDV